MATYTFKIVLPGRIDKMLFGPLLLYRRLRYGYAFRKIPLTRGQFAIVDQNDFGKLREYNWYMAEHNSRNRYAVRMAKTGKKYCRCAMHRVVIDAPDGLFVDHINHNGLDNRKANLRIVTPQQNSWNTRQGRNQGSSEYKGVSWDKETQKWQASIHIDNKLKYLGRFENEKEAAVVYDAAAKEHRGEYAFLNFADG